MYIRIVKIYLVDDSMFLENFLELKTHTFNYTKFE